jgi:hypothetical protein
MDLAMKDEINRIMEILEQSLPQIATLDSMTASQRCVIARIATSSIRLMNRLLIADIDTLESLQEEYLHEIKPLIAKAMQWAADEHLSLLDHHVNDLARRYGIVWERTRVILVVAHAPNEGLIEKSYFNNTMAHHTQLLPEQMKDNYVYTVECPPSLFAQIDIEKTLLQDFLAKSEFDKKVGEQVFEDSTYLFQDILVESAIETLEDLKQRDRSSGCPMQKHL